MQSQDHPCSRPRVHDGYVEEAHVLFIAECGQNEKTYRS